MRIAMELEAGIMCLVAIWQLLMTCEWIELAWMLTRMATTMTMVMMIRTRIENDHLLGIHLEKIGVK